MSVKLNAAPVAPSSIKPTASIGLKPLPPILMILLLAGKAMILGVAEFVIVYDVLAVTVEVLAYMV